jgi:NAD(P)-dependent dehydrogenase (short-subunit alcohol dehydrogenase family)
MSDRHPGKIMVVTGATSGIGLAAAGQLARAGVRVIGISRSAERCRAAEARLREFHPAGHARYIPADLSLQREVRAAAAAVRAELAAAGRDALDGLLNNAGRFSLWRRLTVEGIEQVWALNHLAPFLLTHELLPNLLAAPAARIVTVSSYAHHRGHMHWNDLQLERLYYGWNAYAQSKLANILFARELDRRLGPAGKARAFAVDPGLVKTAIGAKGTPLLVRWIWELWSRRGKTPEEAARDIVKLLLDPAVDRSAGIYWRAGRPVAPSPRALNAADAARLWEISEKMCGIRS